MLATTLIRLICVALVGVGLLGPARGGRLHLACKEANSLLCGHMDPSCPMATTATRAPKPPAEDHSCCADKLDRDAADRHTALADTLTSSLAAESDGIPDCCIVQSTPLGADAPAVRVVGTNDQPIALHTLPTCDETAPAARLAIESTQTRIAKCLPPWQLLRDACHAAQPPPTLSV